MSTSFNVIFQGGLMLCETTLQKGSIHVKKTTIMGIVSCL